jgi:hypothetical protein
MSRIEEEKRREREWALLYGEESIRWDREFRHWIEETAACRITDIDPRQTLKALNDATRRYQASLPWRARRLLKRMERLKKYQLALTKQEEQTRDAFLKLMRRRKTKFSEEKSA